MAPVRKEMRTTPTYKVLLLTVVSFLLSPAVGVAAQESSQNKRGCTLIDGSRHSQFISYEKTVDKEVQLRLHNNTDCTIAVEIDEKGQLGAFRTLPNGEHLFVYVGRPHYGIPMLLHYLVQGGPHSKLPVPGYDWGDSVETYAIPKGESVIFSVPLAYFRKRLDVLVPFRFDWEANDTINMTSGAVAHRVYFLADELPSCAHRRKP